MEKKYKIRWWDYTDKKFNLNGRVCAETMFMFVVMALMVVYYIQPIFSKFLSSLNDETIYIIASVLLILFLIDYIFSNFKADVKSSFTIFNGKREKKISDHNGVVIETEA